jgi:hypothetical protein
MRLWPKPRYLEDDEQLASVLKMLFDLHDAPQEYEDAKQFLETVLAFKIERRSLGQRGL